MIFIMVAVGAIGFGAGRLVGRRRESVHLAQLRAEMETLHDPELLRLAELRRQMQQEQRAFNLLCNYGTELAYGQVSAADMMDREVQA